MNTTLSRARAILVAPHLDDPATEKRLSVTDRLSLRVGLWLLLRAERRLRPRSVDDSLETSAAVRRALARRTADEYRRAAWERAVMLDRPRM
mgnify:CR=1 FL=1